MEKQLKADIGLLLVTVGWGASFILTKDSLSELQTYNFLAIRFLLAFFISAFFYYKRMMKIEKTTLKFGLILGVLLYAHYALQTVGLNYTSASKSAFITGLNVILVPIFYSILSKNIPSKRVSISAILALIGLGFLTLNTNIDGVNIGDIYTLICAFVFAFYIIYVGKYTKDVESISMAIIQLGVVGILSMITSLAFENPTMKVSLGGWINIVVLAIVCTSGAYIVQNVAQKYTTPNHTALIYTCEPVFAGIFGFLFFNEYLGVKGSFGAFLILTGMLMAEINFKKLFNKDKSKSRSK
ncbi:MAG: DMT family transporter [Firmicutes bacterium]|nr:DMT family transporter [Bacillota bacterium]MTI71227.1 DMT family transporter [Bacillota bacterium]